MVPALVCTFLRLSTTVHWVHPMPYKRLRVSLLSTWGDGPCMNLLFHVLRACSDSSQHKHLCVWVREASPLLPPPPLQEVFVLKYGGEGILGERR